MEETASLLMNTLLFIMAVYLFLRFLNFLLRAVENENVKGAVSLLGLLLLVASIVCSMLADFFGN